MDEFELDHLVPLELGGAPSDPRNLWPQAYQPSPGSYEKDDLEDELRRQVCDHEIRLSEAQAKIASDWLSAWKQ